MTAYSGILAGVLAALTLAASPTVARAQSADLVLCDRVAADPADPDKPADVKGVAEIGKSDIATARLHRTPRAGRSTSLAAPMPRTARCRMRWPPGAGPPTSSG